MQEKKKQVSLASQQAQQQSRTDANEKMKSLINFVGDIKSEFKHIEWTSREELANYTKIVVIATAVMGSAIFVADLFIQGALAGLGEIVRLMVG